MNKIVDVIHAAPLPDAASPSSVRSPAHCVLTPRRRAGALHAAVVLASIAAASFTLVACGEQSLEIVELQRPGGKRMAALSFLRGRPIAAGTRFA